MRQNRENNDQKNWKVILFAVCFALVTIGIPGLAVIATIYGIYAWHMKNKSTEGGRDPLSPTEDGQQQEARKQRLLQIIDQEENEELALVHAKSTSETPHQHSDRHVQELKDLLRAGIIEQDEYNDRMRSFRH